MVKKLWKNKNSIDNLSTLRYLLILYGIAIFGKLMRFLTKYPPFSYFCTDRFFHYQNRDVYFSKRKINELVEDLVGWFDIKVVDRDQYFLTLTGSFSNLNNKTDVREKYRQIAKRLEKEDMFLRLNKNGTVKVLVKNSYFLSG